MKRPSPYKLDNHDYWVVCQAASDLTKQACTLSGRHIQDGMLRMQFNRELAYYAKSLVDAVATGKKTPDEALLAMKREHWSLLDQGLKITKQGAGVVAGAFQITSGATICYASGGFLCAFPGVPLIAHGTNNVYENGRDLWEGRSGTEGPLRKGYQAAAKALGRPSRDGNIAYAVTDIGLSIHGMVRMVMKPGVWRLFRYVASDYVRAYKTMSATAILFDAVTGAITGEQIHAQLKK